MAVDPYSMLGAGIMGAFQGFTGGVATSVKPTVDAFANKAPGAPAAPPAAAPPPAAPPAPTIHFVPHHRLVAHKKSRLLKYGLIGGGGLLAVAGIAWKVLH